MKSRSILAVLLGILLFASVGCVQEKTYEQTQREVLLTDDYTDIDGDGLWDYGILEFADTTVEKSMKVKRRLSVVAITSAEYTSFNSLTDLDVLDAGDYLEDFGREQKQAEDECANNIGLISVDCVDVGTCANLCAANSITCKKAAAEYREFLGGSMIYFVQDNNHISSALYDAMGDVHELREGTEGEKNVYLETLRGIVTRIASINANPLFFHPKLEMCDSSDYGVENIVSAAGKIGDYSTEVIGYTYIITIDAEPLLGDDLSTEMQGITIDDVIPLDVVPNSNAISSHQSISTNVEGDNLRIRWISSKVSDAGYIFYYKFDSEKPPEEFVDELMVPAVTVKTMDLSVLGPTNALFLVLLDITGNYYISLGSAVGLTIAFLLFAYDLIILAISIGSARIAGRRAAYGVKRAFGKTRVKWKVDGAVAILLLAAGLYVAAYLAPEPFSVITLVTSLEYLLSEPLAFTGTALMLLGVLMAYNAADNLVKITLLERIYGVAVRKERGTYLQDLEALKKKIETLKRMVKEYAASEFEVSEEYDVLSSISSEKLREFERKMTSYSRAMVDEYMERVDTAIEKLEEKKKLADENWSKWQGEISKTLSEQNEVYSSSLLAVPASLRSWVLAKYVKESEEEGLVFEGSVIRRKKISPLALVKEMVSDGLIKGGIIMKKEDVIASWFERGKSPTVEAALIFKLRSYLNSLNKVVDLGDLASVASVGDDTVFVVMRSAPYDSAVFINKEKFKDAVEAWKKKMKMLAEE